MFPAEGPVSYGVTNVQCPWEADAGKVDLGLISGLVCCPNEMNVM